MHISMRKYVNSNLMIFIPIVLLLSIAATTVPDGILDVTDVKDYSDSAKFFSGDYSAKHRSSHSVLYGLMLSPYVKLTGSFSLLKLSSAFWLSILILSFYYISGKNKKALLLFVTMPLIWYMAPWVSPIPLVGVLFLWAYFFIRKFETGERIKHLALSGLFVGLASAVWTPAIYFSLFFVLAFLYNKKLYFSLIFPIFLIIGLAPRLIVDQIVFGLPFYSILKHTSAVIAFTFYGGIYEGQFYSSKLVKTILFLLFVPFYSYLFFKRKNFSKYKKEFIFLAISMLFVIGNPQPRVLLAFVPIGILILGEILNKKQFRNQIIIFSVISLLVVAPYIIQSSYEMNEKRFDSAVLNINNLEISKVRTDQLIVEDLKTITNLHPDEVFLVGNKNDDYRQLAHLYWGDSVKEFVSIEDYNLFFEDENIVASKRISSESGKRFRREVWVEVGLGRNSNDNTDYNNIEYGIGIGEPRELEGYEVVEKFNILHLSKKSK